MSPRRSSRHAPEPASAGVLGPDAIEVGTRTLQVGSLLHHTFAVTSYPREVSAGWLEPLLGFAGPVEVALHVEPVPPQAAADRLRRQRARLESTRHLDADHGRLDDVEVEAAAEDARDLASRLARGQGRLFRVGLYVTVRGRDHAELEEQVGQVRALLDSLLLTAHPATYRTLQGWLTTQPYGMDGLRLRRTFDTQALAAAFPFASGELPSASGVLYGRTPQNGLVLWDRFAQDNYNAVILARSGAGKSYLTKLELLRSLYRGIQGFVIDPEDEYGQLADAVGGVTIRLGQPDVRINPFDLQTGDGADALIRRGLFLHTLTEVLLGQPLDPATTAALDRAVINAYAAAGISSDPRTHRRPPPLLRDLAEQLAQDADPAATTLAARLAPYTTGTHRRLFDGPTTHQPDSHLVVFSLKALPEELTSVGTLLTLDAIWRQVSNPAQRRRRLVTVDEAWLLMQHPAGARFLYRLAKAARKHWCGLTTVSQDAADLLGTQLGQAVVANATTHILLRQAPQAIDALTETFKLSDGERSWLRAARTGEALLAAGTQRIALRIEASRDEHPLVTSDPQELAEPPEDPDAAGGALTPVPPAPPSPADRRARNRGR